MIKLAEIEFTRHPESREIRVSQGWNPGCLTDRDREQISSELIAIARKVKEGYFRDGDLYRHKNDFTPYCLPLETLL